MNKWLKETWAISRGIWVGLTKKQPEVDPHAPSAPSAETIKIYNLAHLDIRDNNWRAGTDVVPTVDGDVPLPLDELPSHHRPFDLRSTISENFRAFWRSEDKKKRDRERRRKNATK